MPRSKLEPMGFTMLPVLALLLQPPPPQAQRIHLEPGDYRYMPVAVRKTPAEINCRFQVLSGAPAVHVEILRRRDLLLFLRGREHTRVAATSDSGSAAIRHVVDDPGDYEVLIANSKDAAATDVNFEVSVDSDPNPAVYTRELSPQRRLTVILISFGVFFAIVTVCGIRLTRVFRRTD